MDTSFHPNAKTLAAFAARRLGDEKREMLDHIVECPSCSRIVLDFRGFVRDPDPETDRSWARFQADQGLVADVREDSGIRSGPRWRLAMAAGGVMLVTLAAVAMLNGLSLGNARRELVELRMELNELVEPQINVPTADALPWTSLRGAREPAVLDFGVASRIGVVRLVLIEDPASDGLRLDVVDPEGTPVAQLDGLQEDADGNLTIAVARDWLASGRYVLRLSDVDAPSDVLAEYRLLIQKSEAGAE